MGKKEQVPGSVEQPSRKLFFLSLTGDTKKGRKLQGKGGKELWEGKERILQNQLSLQQTTGRNKEK